MSGIHPNSVQAYWQGDVSLFGKRHQQVIAALRAMGAATDREVMLRLGFQDPNSVRPRITELVEQGVIIEVGSATCPVTHKTVRIIKLAAREAQAEFDLSPQAVAALARASSQ